MGFTYMLSHICTYSNHKINRRNATFRYMRNATYDKNTARFLNTKNTYSIYVPYCNFR
jgi:hypothetical protein